MVATKIPTTWRIEGLWPGMEPVYMGWVYADTEYKAWEQATQLYPQVSAWNIIRLT